jgi:signal transduction histidine kinase
MNASLPHAPIRALLLRNIDNGNPVTEKSLLDRAPQFEMVEVDSLSAAFSQLQDRGFQVVLVEIGATRSSVESLRRLRAHFSHLPVIALVQHEVVRDARMALGDDAQDFVVTDHLSSEILEWSIQNVIRHARRPVDFKQFAREIAHVDKRVQRMNRAIARQHRMIARLADSAGHDFRSALTVVREHASLVHDGLCGEVNAEQERMLSTVCDRVDDLCRMVYDVECFGKLCTGRFRPQRRKCQIRDIVGPVAHQLAAKSLLHGLTFVADDYSSTPPVYCDPEMLAHVLLTLGTRAVHSCSANGQIRMRVEEDHVLHQIRIGVAGSASTSRDRNAQIHGDPLDQAANGGHPERPQFCLETTVAKEIVDRNFGHLTETSILGRDARLSFDISVAVPEEILARYVNWLHRSPRNSREIAVLRARIDGHCPHGSGSVIDRHFHELLRPDELLLRIGDLEWLTFIPVRFSIAKRMRKIKNSLTRTLLPADIAKIKIVDEGTWSISRRTRDILEELHVHELHAAKRRGRPSRMIEPAFACAAPTL